MRSDLSRAMGRASVAAVPLLLLACAAQDTPPPNARDSGRVDVGTLAASGETRRCIQRAQVNSTRPAGDQFLMVSTGPSRWFRNELRRPCPGAARSNTTIVFRNAQPTICSGDSFDLFDRMTRMNVGFCTLGDFTPVTVPRGTRF